MLPPSVIVKLKKTVFEYVVLILSVAFTPTLYVPAIVGEPEISPDSEINIPVGKFSNE